MATLNEYLSGLQPKTVLGDRIKLFLQMTQFFHDTNKDNTGFALDAMEQVKVVGARLRSKDEKDPSVPSATVIFEITCANNVLNPMGSMHGGCVATLYDNLSTYSVSVLQQYWEEFDPEKENLETYALKFINKVQPDMGVSRQLQVIYLRALVPGQKVFLEVNLVSSSKRYATYTARMYDGQGRVYSTMTHDKAKTLPERVTKL
ncbi:hypothetical protein D0Z00_003317 [Geotrichum galactomycetum]|uniref:Uncharacterized protein n=1 Tax=Geotrichum galactomycetum TaxID=27317 RepID=A0ACB6V1M3_9ASCO|nr:hypothetical protein D0Z00_003317 [Geotrichum candidum]